MRKKRALIAISFVTIVALLAIIFIGLKFGRRASTLAAASRLRVGEVEAVVDRLYSDVRPQRSNGIALYPRLPIPSEFEAAAPKSMRLTDKGVYLVIYNTFVEEDGIFILKDDSDFTPSSSGDPSYEKVEGRVYIYHISG